MKMLNAVPSERFTTLKVSVLEYPEADSPINPFKKKVLLMCKPVI